MKVVFLGTRGYIEATSARHRRHASALVSYHRRSVMIDCGEDWINRVADVGPRAIVVTHPHPDHAGGLVEGAPCPVYATEEAWEVMDDFRIEDDLRRVLSPRRPETIAGIEFEAFPVQHSTRAPAVGYRVTAGRAAVFYVPDVVYIENRAEALRGVRFYVGDGATVERSMVRKDGNDNLIGHTPIRTQLTWCKKEGVPEMVVTHCGSDLVAGDERSLIPKLEHMAEERGVTVTVAHDGMERVLR